MATITLKAIPDDVHAQLKRQAAAAGMSVRAYVLELIQRDLDRPSPQEWLAGLEQLERVELDRPVAELIREGRGEPPADAGGR